MPPLKHMFLSVMNLTMSTTLKTCILIIAVVISNTMTVQLFMTNTTNMDSKKLLSRKSQAPSNFLSPKLANLMSYADTVHGSKNQMTFYPWQLI